MANAGGDKVSDELQLKDDYSTSLFQFCVCLDLLYKPIVLRKITTQSADLKKFLLFFLLFSDVYLSQLVATYHVFGVFTMQCKVYRNHTVLYAGNLITISLAYVSFSISCF